jgi:colanic acid/amylovoran biosynthesis glycosyltransferase
MMELSDIFLYPGITFNKRGENQGLVLQEAQAMQLPVLISDAGGMQEGVTDGVTGFVLPENDILGFVRNIELLASDSLLRKKMGEAGRQMVTEKYNIDLLNIQLLKLYQK